MSNSRDSSQQPSPQQRPVCTRTNAVLAVHLDGDLAYETFDQEAYEPLGYGFVSNDSLHSHLRECTTCQLALDRARRLDAELATMAGRDVADQVATIGCSLEQLGERWLECAAMVATEHVPARANATTINSTPSTNTQPEDPIRAEDLDQIFERANQLRLGAQLPSRNAGAHTGRMIAFAGLLAACLVTSICIATLGTTTEHGQSTQQTLALNRTDEHQTHRKSSAAAVLAPTVTAKLSPSQLLTRSIHSARNQKRPQQDRLVPEDLSLRVRNRDLGLPERLAAASSLLRATHFGSSNARHATDQLLLALASCGDLNQADITLHAQLLDEIRNNNSVLTRLENQLSSLPPRNRAHSKLSHQTLAAIIVATRVGNTRLDLAIRRALRRNNAIAEVIAGALRCSMRVNGSTQLLLNCWNDQVATGSQENTARWATFWFRGQDITNFAMLAQAHNRSHSAPERVRCLLAMGCAPDDSTLQLLLAQMASPRRVEACAAAYGLAALPHRVLKQLLPKSKSQNAYLLRAALARAGMPEAEQWIQALALRKPQMDLLRTGPITRFPEIASWFRNARLTTD